MKSLQHPVGKESSRGAALGNIYEFPQQRDSVYMFTVTLCSQVHVWPSSMISDSFSGDRVTVISRVSNLKPSHLMSSEGGGGRFVEGFLQAQMRKETLELKVVRPCL